MDLNFGEIVEPVSRAFYDDYEDDSLNLPFKRFVYVFLHCHVCNFSIRFRPVWKYSDENGQSKIPAKIPHFIIIEGNNALNVIQPSILKKTVPMAKLEGHKVEVFQLGSFTVCVAEEKDLNYFATITELLEPWIKSAENCTMVGLR